MAAYSDRIAHAFAFAAKYAPGARVRGGGLAELADAANLAVILSRYECDEPTIVAGVLHLVLRDSEGAERAALEQKVREKFGSIVLAILEDVLAPPSSDLNRERAWEACRREYLARLATAEPRALDICAATEIHNCGSALADVRRLGAEYFSSASATGPRQALWWYRALADALSAHDDWPRREMLLELAQLSRELEMELALGS
jgi:(p)ppGpp synthase/HD superfamily hydrolase